MVAGALDDGHGPRVAHGETLADLPADVDFATGGAIKERVARNDACPRVKSASGWRNDDNAAAGEPLAQIVVGFTFENEVDARHEKGSERLACRPGELHVDFVIVQAGGTTALRHFTREESTDRAVCVADIHHHRYTLQAGRFVYLTQNAYVFHGRKVELLRPDTIQGVAALDAGQQAVEREQGVLGLFHIRFADNQLRVTDDVVKLFGAQFSQQFAHLLRQEAEVVDEVFTAPCIVFA